MLAKSDELLPKADIERRFTYHPPKAGQPQQYEALRAGAKALALQVVDLCPDTRERALALTAIEEAVADVRQGPDTAVSGQALGRG